jgi:hypothetical protein
MDSCRQSTCLEGPGPSRRQLGWDVADEHVEREAHSAPLWSGEHPHQQRGLRRTTGADLVCCMWLFDGLIEPSTAIVTLENPSRHAASGTEPGAIVRAWTCWRDLSTNTWRTP